MPNPDLTFSELQTANELRSRPPYFKHALEEWTPMDWVAALAGEVGEAANIVKKVRRGDFGIDDLLPRDPSSRTVRKALAHEIADVVGYTGLLALRCGIDLAEAVIEKFNIVSDRVGAGLIKLQGCPHLRPPWINEKIRDEMVRTFTDVIMKEAGISIEGRLDVPKSTFRHIEIGIDAVCKMLNSKGI